jgi:hypothetical protein
MRKIWCSEKRSPSRRLSSRAVARLRPKGFSITRRTQGRSWRSRIRAAAPLSAR